MAAGVSGLTRIGLPCATLKSRFRRMALHSGFDVTDGNIATDSEHSAHGGRMADHPPAPDW